MLEKIIAGKLFQAHGVAGLFPANSQDEDVVVFEDEQRAKEKMRFHFLRIQEIQEEPGKYNLSLADYVSSRESGLADYLGAFVVGIFGADVVAHRFKQSGDDYNGIMTKMLADRLAEAFAELLHEKVRKDLWGYQAQEHFSLPELLRERYSGIRPACGYPACPEHSEKVKLFELLSAQQHTGVSLTENFSMVPGASVSGWYFAHPHSRYFNLGKVTKEQVELYANKKKISLPEAEKLLNLHLAY